MLARRMRCSRSAALNERKGIRMLRILHLIRRVPRHLLLKEKAIKSVSPYECHGTVIIIAVAD